PLHRPALPLRRAGAVHRHHPPEAHDGGRGHPVRGDDGTRRNLPDRLAPTDPRAGDTERMTANDLPFVMRTADLLTEGGFRVWLFGGWAEELRGLTPPQPHRDVDLLYPGPDFRRLDEFLAGEVVEEWTGKRRPYRRA